uniref:Ovule protein n=1 Tax=Mesocestoides corti TaxID=53468 RepID=A0A5K3FSM3_MESCO
VFVEHSTESPKLLTLHPTLPVPPTYSHLRVESAQLTYSLRLFSNNRLPLVLLEHNTEWPKLLSGRPLHSMH